MLTSPLIIDHSEDNTDKGPENAIAVEQYIKRVILPQKSSAEKYCPVELASFVDNFWSERESFVKHYYYFA